MSTYVAMLLGSSGCSNRSLKASCVIFPPQFHFYMQGGWTADSYIVWTLAKETSVCHGQLCFLFGVVHLGRLEVGSWKFQKGNSDLRLWLERSFNLRNVVQIIWLALFLKLHSLSSLRFFCFYMKWESTNFIIIRSCYTYTHTFLSPTHLYLSACLSVICKYKQPTYQLCACQLYRLFNII